MKNSLSIFALLILGAIMMAFTESVTITGTVKDDQGQPIAGVNVTVKGYSKGTVTDLNGFYRITVSDQAKTLMFSFIGYSAVEEKIGGRVTINVIMGSEKMALDEVVVIGYGASRDMASKSIAMSAPAGSGRGEDEDGYRSELIRLINTVKDMRVIADK